MSDNPLDDLTQKQRVWVLAYTGELETDDGEVIDTHFCGKEAAKVAGYSHPMSSARDNHASDKCQEAIDYILESRRVGKNAFLDELHQHAFGPDTDSALKKKAWDLLAKAQGFNRQQVELSGPDGGPVEHDVTSLSDEELEARLAAVAGDDDDDE